jgi:hypothetical protein
VTSGKLILDPSSALTSAWGFDQALGNTLRNVRGRTRAVTGGVGSTKRLVTIDLVVTARVACATCGNYRPTLPCMMPPSMNTEVAVM